MKLRKQNFITKLLNHLNLGVFKIMSNWPNRTDPKQTWSNPITQRVNNGWISTNPTTFGSGSGHSIDQPNRLTRQFYTKIHHFHPTRPNNTRTDPTRQYIGSESGSNFSNRTNSVRVSGDPKPEPTREHPYLNRKPMMIFRMMWLILFALYLLLRKPIGNLKTCNVDRFFIRGWSVTTKFVLW